LALIRVEVPVQSPTKLTTRFTTFFYFE